MSYFNVKMSDGSVARIPIGRDGKTLVKGVDYFTEDDANEIVQRVIQSLGGVTPELVTFVADGVTVATVTYEAGATSIEESAVPAKDGYTGVWETYDLSNGDNITVNAVYTAIEVGPTEPTNFFDTSGDGYLNLGRLSQTGLNRTDLTSNIISNYIPVQTSDVV